MRCLYASDPTGTANNRLVVMEYEPMRIPTALKGSEEMFALWTPYLVTTTSITSKRLRVFARTAPVGENGDDMCYHLGWPHIDSQGGVCYHPDMFSELYTPSLTATPAERDEAQAVACMQMFLNGGSSYWLCDSHHLPRGFRDIRGTYDDKGFRGGNDVGAFFARWEALDEAQVCALEYTPYGRLADIIDFELTPRHHLLPELTRRLK